jgi:hypothetical protein
MNDQVIVLRDGRHAHKTEVAEGMADIQRLIGLQMHAAGADQRQPRCGQRLSQSRLRYEALFTNHRTGVAFVDGVPEARPELRPDPSRGSAVDEALLSAAVMNPSPGPADEIEMQMKEKEGQSRFVPIQNPGDEFAVHLFIAKQALYGLAHDRSISSLPTTSLPSPRCNRTNRMGFPRSSWAAASRRYGTDMDLSL